MFEVSFVPPKSNFYFCEEAEAYVYFKTNRTFRLVNDAAFVPPWCVPVRLLGHSFEPTVEQFLPSVDINIHGGGQKIEFPPCHLGDAVHANFSIKNTSDTPCMFSFGADPSGHFSILPSSGLVGPGKSQVLTARFVPSDTARKRCAVMCVLNGIAGASQRIELSGVGCRPAAAAADVLYVKPTALGLVSRATFPLKNLSRIPLRYEWTLSSSTKKIIDVIPSEGYLRGNETIHAVCKHAPSAMGAVNVVAPLLVSSLGRPTDEIVQQSTLSILSEGTEKSVVLKPQSIDFGTFLVGTKTSREVTIVNSGDCDLVYELFAEIDQGTKTDVVVFDKPKGVLTARSRTVVVATFSPKLAGAYAFTFSCEMQEAYLDQDGAAAATTTIKEKDLGTSMLLWGAAYSSNNSSEHRKLALALRALLLDMPPTCARRRRCALRDVERRQDMEAVWHRGAQQSAANAADKRGSVAPEIHGNKCVRKRSWQVVIRMGRL